MVASNRTLSNPSHIARGVRPLRRPFLTAFLFLFPLGTALLSALAAAEGDKSSPQPQDATPSLRDVEATIRAREALGKDPELAPLNLGVKVRKGEATLWGPIPSEALIRRAVQVLDNVRGVYKVHSELTVVAPQPGPVVLPLPGPPLRTESASPDRVASQRNEFPGRTTETPGAHVTLRGPVVANDPPSKPDAPPVARKPDPMPVESVEKAVGRLRQGDLRFQSIKAEVRGGTVVVHGGTVRGEYVTAFAQAVSRLPGVEHVVVESKR
jgi:osmotically-inducible protein OsmY